MVYSYSSE